MRVFHLVTCSVLNACFSTVFHCFFHCGFQIIFFFHTSWAVYSAPSWSLPKNFSPGIPSFTHSGTHICFQSTTCSVNLIKNSSKKLQSKESSKKSYRAWCKAPEHLRRNFLEPLSKMEPSLPSTLEPCAPLDREFEFLSRMVLEFPSKLVWKPFSNQELWLLARLAILSLPRFSFYLFSIPIKAY